MQRENEVGLYPLTLLRLTSTSAANEQEPSWIDVNLTGTDALISVWWDYPPCPDPR